jgi:hypothetical protein
VWAPRSQAALLPSWRIPRVRLHDMLASWQLLKLPRQGPAKEIVFRHNRRSCPSDLCRQLCHALLRLRDDPQIRLEGFPTIGKFLFGFFIRNRRWDDDIIARPPVYGRGNVMFRSELN